MISFRAFWGQLNTVNKIAVCLLLIVAVTETISMLQFTAGGDASNHIYRIGMWHNMWQQGIYYPRWLPETFHGFGSPSFYFYPPLVYFTSSFLYLGVRNVSPDTMYRIVLTLFCFGSYLTFYFYLRSRGAGAFASIIAALLYAFAPYRYLDAEVRGAIAEHAVFFLLPVILWGADRILADSKRDNASLIAVAIGLFGILATNIPASGVTICGLAVYAAAHYRPDRKAAIYFFAAAIIIGGLLSAFILLPPLQFGNAINQGMFKQEIYSFGESNTPLLDIFSGKNITINLLCVLTVVGGAMLWPTLRNKPEPAGNSRAYLWIIALVLIIQLPYFSILIFKYFPPATLIQFPWRFDILLIPIAAMLWARGLDSDYADDHFSRKQVSFVAICWTVVLLAIAGARIGGFTMNPHVQDPSASTWEYISTRWAPSPGHVMDSVMDSVMQPYRAMPEANAQDLSNSESFEIMNHSAYRDSLLVRFDRPHTVVFHRFYWQQWKVRIDGGDVETMPDSVGRLSIRVPSGRHEIALELATSLSEKIGMWTSIVTLAGLIAFCIIRKK